MFQPHSTPAHCSHTAYKLLCHEMLDFFMAPKFYIPDFNPVDYRI